MNATPRSVLMSSLVLVAVLAVAALAGRSNVAHAATVPGAVPLVSIGVEKKNGTFKVAPSAGSGTGSGTGKSKSGSSNSTDATASKWLEISIRNVGDGDISGLTVNYHVYVRTIASSSTSNTDTLTDSAGSATIDIPHAGVKQVETTPITASFSSSSSSSKSKKVSSSSTSISSTDIAGWYIEVDYNGKPILRPNESPSGIKARYEKSQGN
jgi:hypothetical protein